MSQGSQVGEPRGSILVVEDDRGMITLLRTVFEMQGWPVVVARTVDEALAALDRAAPALLTLDLTLPGPNRSEQVAARARARYGAAVPIIVITGAPEGHDVARQIGAAECLEKPFSAAALLSAVRRAMAGPAAGGGTPRRPTPLAAHEVGCLGVAGCGAPPPAPPRNCCSQAPGLA